MHNLNLADGTPNDYLTQIIDGKTGHRGARLTTMGTKLKDSYTDLESAYSPTKISGIKVKKWTQAEKDDLLHCYDRPAKALNELKRKITERQAEGIRDFCPYCGIGAPRQFDHYLPKAKFPELCVHFYNLVPCCGSCNGIKGEKWLKNDGSRTFINFYIDSLPTEPIVRTDIDWIVKNGKIVPIMSFKLIKPPAFGAAEFMLIESHFKHLKLLARYKDQAHTEFLALRDAAKAREANTIEELKEFLQSYLMRRQNTLGPLNWRISLHGGIIEHDPFLQDCLKI